jgi:hypothetical protein
VECRKATLPPEELHFLEDQEKEVQLSKVLLEQYGVLLQLLPTGNSVPAAAGGTGSQAGGGELVSISVALHAAASQRAVRPAPPPVAAAFVGRASALCRIPGWCGHTLSPN